VHRHRFDPAALLAGLLFLTVALLYAAAGLTGRALVPIEFLGPAIFVGLGVVGLVRVLTRAGRRDP
jgi:hypothetical protein